MGLILLSILSWHGLYSTRFPLSIVKIRMMVFIQQRNEIHCLHETDADTSDSSNKGLHVGTSSISQKVAYRSYTIDHIYSQKLDNSSYLDTTEDWASTRQLFGIIGKSSQD
jgi:hypothetical protein